MDFNEYGIQAGDYVIGSYTENGTKKKEGRFEGNKEDVAALITKMEEHSKQKGSPLIVPGVKKKKVKAKAKRPVSDKEPETTSFFEEPEEEEIAAVVAEPEPAKQFVTFSNAFGRIRVKVIDVLDSEDFGLAVIFANEEDLTFIPKQGETLEFIDFNDKSYNVYFPGLVFTWTDGLKKVMVLVKSVDESE